MVDMKKVLLATILSILVSGFGFAHGKGDVEEISVENMNSWQAVKMFLNCTEAHSVITALTVMSFMMKRLLLKAKTLQINFRTVKNAAAL